MIVLLNCSYKGDKSNTRYFFELLMKETEKQSEASTGRRMKAKHDIVNIKDILAGKPEEYEERLGNFAVKLKEADALVIGAPLYVDGLPAQAVKLLEDLLEDYGDSFQGLHVYAVSNLGFYESTQIKHLLSMIRNWCLRMGMIYGGGLSVGAGPMVVALKDTPLEKWAGRQLEEGVAQLADTIIKADVMNDCYCQSNVPRWAYKMAAHMIFGKTVKKNGLRVEDAK